MSKRAVLFWYKNSVFEIRTMTVCRAVRKGLGLARLVFKKFEEYFDGGSSRL